jgi:hypothetical protein
MIELIAKNVELVYIIGIRLLYTDKNKNHYLYYFSDSAVILSISAAIKAPARSRFLR